MTTKRDDSLPFGGELTRSTFLKTAGAASLGVAGLLTAEGQALARTPEAKGVKVEFLTVSQPNTSWSQNLAAITKKNAKTHPGTSFVNDYVPQTQINQKIQLLAGQNALPVLYNTPALDLTNQLRHAGEAMNLGATLHHLGASGALVPAAVSILQKVYGKPLVAFPFELNMEGFWYNKAIFRKHKVSPPTAWAELVHVAAHLHSKGVQPFSASGIQGWPLTRLVGNYLFRTYGPSAMENVHKGHVRLTSPGYVKAAAAVASLGKKGYFGRGVATIDYTPAVNLFLQGKAAMFYMGSWELRDFTDPSVNKIGENNIGFFPFPNVHGGRGNLRQTPMNAGQPSSVNKRRYTPAFGKWMTYMAHNYADTALDLQGVVTGFKTYRHHNNVNRLTKLVIDEIASVRQPVLWFEALFSAKATTVSQQDAALLVTGQMSPSSFMSNVQAAL